jgi:hypothetical protein
MTAAAFRASYVGVRPIQGRKVCQFVFETPIEEADAALAALGGLPRPDTSTWAAIARIDPAKAANGHAKPEEAPAKERRRFHKLDPAQQAAMRCKEEAFQRFIIEEHDGFGDEKSVAEFVRSFCDVDSRSKIKLGTPAAGKWVMLENEYVAWLNT